MKYFIQLILIGTIVYLLFVFFRMLKKEKSRRGTINSDNQAEEIKRDPVCGTYIPVSQAIHLKENKKNIYFCSEKCLKKYKTGKKGNFKE